ncbi:alcohol dehydrogenase catalytic domain-containing protein [Microbacterium sp. NPDC058342]|uniref:alcohol dehydrogenase catalytic domain-containing protein n=1 Tax=Microbacterium sp. NPDC058342 TaxID=3346454 RepID=UPI00365C6BC2
MTETMSAVRVGPGGGVAVRSTPRPAPGAGEVRIDVAYGGICGSDLHYATSGRNGSFEVMSFLTLGHEFSGVVSGHGDGVDGPPLGTHVTVHPAQPCARAGEGPTGRHLLTGSYLGSASTLPHTQGGFADSVVVKADQVRVLPSALPLRRAALAEPLAVALHAIHLAGELAGERVLVVGCGPIGLLAVAAARISGARVAAADIAAQAIERAVRLGAATSYLIPDQSPPSGGFDVVIEASGAAAAIRGAFRQVADGGTVIQLAIPSVERADIEVGELIRREIVYRGTWRFDTEIDEAVVLLRDHPELDEVITHEFPVAEATEAFEVAQDSQRSSKVLLRFDR